MTVPEQTQIWAHHARFTKMIPSAMPRLFARLYDAPFYRTMHEKWLDTLPLAGKETALDIGCGPGGLSGALAARGLEVTGLDRSDDMVAMAQQREQWGSASFVQGDAAALPCAESSFDVAMCSSLLNIVEDPAPVLQEMARVLRPKGIISVLLPDPTLTEAAALAHSRSADLPDEDAALLLLWASKAPKISLAQAILWFTAQGMTRPRQDPLLDGLVHVTTWGSPA